MQQPTLYNLTRAEAKALLEACDNNVAMLAVALYDRGRAADLQRALYKAKRLAKHAGRA